MNVWSPFLISLRGILVVLIFCCAKSFAAELPDPDLFDGLNQNQQHQSQTEESETHSHTTQIEKSPHQDSEESPEKKVEQQNGSSIAQQKQSSPMARQAESPTQGKEPPENPRRAGQPGQDGDNRSGSAAYASGAGQNPPLKVGGVSHEDFIKTSQESNPSRQYQRARKKSEGKIKVPEDYEDATSLVKAKQKIDEQLSEKYEKQGIEQTVKNRASGAEHGQDIPEGL